MNLDAAEKAAVAAGLSVSHQTSALGPWLSVVDPKTPTDAALSWWPDGRHIVTVSIHDGDVVAAAQAWSARIAPVLAAARGGK